MSVDYKLVGRYIIDGVIKDYHLECLSDSAYSGKYTIDEVLFLAGRGEIENCVWCSRNGKPYIRSKRGKLLDLPVLD